MKTYLKLGEFHLYRHDLPEYMERWILQAPWGHLRVHHILRSDEDRHLHDHPFDFWSFLLTGGYREWLPATTPDSPAVRWEDRPRWSLVRKKAKDAHRLELRDGPVWTLVWTGRWKRRWGFWAADGWVYWRDYFGIPHDG